MGRYFISDRRTGDPPPTPTKGRGTGTHPFIYDRRTKGQDTPFYLIEGQKDMIPPVLFRRMKVGRRPERPKQVSPRQRLGNSKQPTFAQNGQKNYYSAHSLCHSVVVGCYSFAPFWGVSLLHPIPGRCPGLAYQCPIRGVNLHPIYIRRALPGAGISLPLRGVGSLTFRRICYPPELNIRIFNPQ